MQALLDTAPPPSPPPGGGEKKEGVAPEAAQALPPGRERFIPVSRYGRAHLDTLWDRLLDVDSLDQAAPSTA